MTCRDEDLYERARAVFPGGSSRSTVFVPPHPPYAMSGKGCVLTDVNGCEVYDCNNNYTSLLHGHASEPIVDAATDTIRHGSAFGLPTETEVDLAELLSTRTGMARWRFCNSGTEAVMMAIRAARAATGRDRVIRFDGSYHGTYDEVVHPSAAGIPRTVAENTLVLAQADAEAFEQAVAEHHNDVAAVVLDLMPNRAGLCPVSDEFAELVRHRTVEHGILLIVDEVITFRLEPGGLRARYGIDADLTTVGKVIGGGFPVGAIGGSEAALRSFDPFGSDTVSWGGTFSANPVSMRAGLTALQMFARDEITRLNVLGDHLRDQLRSAGLRVNGSGSLSRLLLDDYRESWWRLYELGVLVGTSGLMALSTPMTEQDVASIAERVVAAIR